MSGLKYILSILDYRLHKRLYAVPEKDCMFPVSVAGFSIIKSLNTKSVTGFFKFALYKNDRGKEVFCKVWFGKRKNIGYLWLKNEIAVYKYLSDVKAKSDIKTPKYYGEFEDGHMLMLFIENIKGRNVWHLSNKERIQVFEKVVNYFKNIKIENIPQKHDIITIKPFFQITGLFFLMLISFFKYKSLRAYLMLYLVLYIKYYLQILRDDESCLIHRDIIKNIFKKGNEYFITDFQVTLFTNPLLEISNLSLGLYPKKNLYQSFAKSDLYLKNTANVDKHNLYKLFCLQSALYELISLHNMKKETVFNYIRYVYHER